MLWYFTGYATSCVKLISTLDVEMKATDRGTIFFMSLAVQKIRALHMESELPLSRMLQQVAKDVLTYSISISGRSPQAAHSNSGLLRDVLYTNEG